MKNQKKYSLKLGQKTDVVLSVFTRNIALVYTGQVQDYVYSIAIIQSKGNNSYAYNVYFNADQKEFYINKDRIDILNVDAKTLEFAYMRS